VRVTLADGQVLAGTLHRAADTDASSKAYLVVSDPVEEGHAPVEARIDDADRVTQIEDASSDPAAVE
jgi:hypothetical protein